MVATYDEAGAVGVKEEDGGCWWGGLEEVVLEGEVEVGVGATGDVNLGLTRWVGREVGDRSEGACGVIPTLESVS